MNSLFLSIIILLNVTLLAILVPGGPIENRDFSNLKGLVFWGFNAFLITLGMASFYAIYSALGGLSNTGLVTSILACAYILVYGLDLAGIFPKSPSKMSKPLMLIEIINLCMAIYLFILSIVL
jgi:hypothetical protein